MSSRVAVLVIDDEMGMRGTLPWELALDGLDGTTLDSEDRARLFGPRTDADVRRGRTLRLDVESALAHCMLSADGAEISAGVMAKVGIDLQIAPAAGGRR